MTSIEYALRLRGGRTLTKDSDGELFVSRVDGGSSSFVSAVNPTAAEVDRLKAYAQRERFTVLTREIPDLTPTAWAEIKVPAADLPVGTFVRYPGSGGIYVRLASDPIDQPWALVKRGTHGGLLSRRTSGEMDLWGFEVITAAEVTA